jgi:dUTP pyrophosphatase
MYILYIVPTTEMKAVYEAIAATYLSKPAGERDAGFDLVSPPLEVSGPVVRISQQCSAALYDTVKRTFRAYWMLPRSSLSKTPLRLANSVGLIDAGYRGTLYAALDVHASMYTIDTNTRLLQIAAPDLLPFDDIQIVSDIPGGPTLRGDGGFGSTGTVTVVPALAGGAGVVSAAPLSPSHGYFTPPE